MFGFYRAALVTPSVAVGNPEKNVGSMLEHLNAAIAGEAQLVCFPELALSGYTCADLFMQKDLLDKVESQLLKFASACDSDALVVVGAPLRYGHQLFNCGVAIQNGRIRAVVPKINLPNYQEFYEARWFSSGDGVLDSAISIGGEAVPFGVDIILDDGAGFVMGIEICEDLWSPNPPSSMQAIAGAVVHVNLSASPEVIGKDTYRRQLVTSQSGRNLSAYLYVGAGPSESTADLVFAGHNLAAEGGSLIAEASQLCGDPAILSVDIDAEKMRGLRLHEGTFQNQFPTRQFRRIEIAGLRQVAKPERRFTATPFVPSGGVGREERCSQTVALQSAGLKKRLDHTRAQKLVVGVSGGLDSTLALLVGAEVCKRSDTEASILAISMPGPGTSSRTRENAAKLAKSLDVDFQELDIGAACNLHLEQLGITYDDHAVAFENVQARERTQILMDVANKHRGLVLGTGDMSEIALGWCTYNGDHMSMYNVNAGVPKTLVKYLVRWYAEKSPEGLCATLEDILATPISPELVPQESGAITQKTEELLGPYDLHDFFLYHYIRYGASRDRMKWMALQTFAERFSEDEIDRTCETFLRRFFQNQFKRNAMPDGPKIGTIALSPRGDWRMPSDADY